MHDGEDDQILEGPPDKGREPMVSEHKVDDAERVTPENGSHVERSRTRNREKGFDFTGGGLINPNGKPLGRPIAGRSWLDVPVLIFDRRPGGVPCKPVADRFDQALELNARTIQAYIDATDDRALTPEIHSALDNLPELDDSRYADAIRCMTNFRSMEAHRASIAATAKRVVREERHIRTLRYALLVRETLGKGKAVAEIRHMEESRFAHDNVKKNQAPSEPVLLRTFLPDTLKDKDDRSVAQVKRDLAKLNALEPCSDVSFGELVGMAFYAVLNPVWIYTDFTFLTDLLDLSVFAGREAYGFREMLDKHLIETYRSMLCGGGDKYPDPKAWPARAHVAALVRARWRASPYLVKWTRYQGRLLEP